jgi:hypothetical protein
MEGEFREGLWAECVDTVPHYENIIVNKEEKKFTYGANVQ